jgi:hypothetical protein
MQDNPRYSWLGEVSQTGIRCLYAQSHAMVISSVMEGGATRQRLSKRLCWQ